MGSLKFVGLGLDNTVSTNRKSISDVLQSCNWSGHLPVVQRLRSTWASLISVQACAFVGTFFTPSQPHIHVVLTGTQAVASNVEARMQFSGIDDQVGVEETDEAQIVLVNAGLALVQFV